MLGTGHHYYSNIDCYFVNFFVDSVRYSNGCNRSKQTFGWDGKLGVLPVSQLHVNVSLNSNKPWLNYTKFM